MTGLVDSAPSLATVASAVGIGIGAVIVTVVAYFHKRRQTQGGSDVAVVSATFADRQTVQELVAGMAALRRAIEDAGDRRHRDTTDEREAIVALTRSVEGNSKAIKEWRNTADEMRLALFGEGSIPPDMLTLVAAIKAMKDRE